MEGSGTSSDPKHMSPGQKAGTKGGMPAHPPKKSPPFVKEPDTGKPGSKGNKGTGGPPMG